MSRTLYVPLPLATSSRCLGMVGDRCRSHRVAVGWIARYILCSAMFAHLRDHSHPTSHRKCAPPALMRRLCGALCILRAVRGEAVRSSRQGAAPHAMSWLSAHVPILPTAATQTPTSVGMDQADARSFAPPTASQGHRHTQNRGKYNACVYHFAAALKACCSPSPC